MMNKENMDTVGLGMKNGGMTKKMGYSKGGMTKKAGYAKGGMCGASNPAARPVKKVK